MKVKSVVLLAVAVACGLVAMLGVQQVLSGRQQAKSDEMAQVLVAIADIAPNTPLNEKNVVFKKLPASAVPAGAVTKVEQYEERALRTGAVVGEFIMAAKLGEKGVFSASSSIPEGMRVVTVPVNMTTTHSGLIQPGDRVDVLVTYMTGKRQTKTETVLESVEVFATDAMRQAGGDTSEINAKNISLLVSPDHATILMSADKAGDITLALLPKSENPVAHAPKTEFNSDKSDEPAVAQNSVEGSGAENGDVRKFLEDEGKQPGAVKAEGQQQPAVPAKPMWKVVIQSGTESVTQEFEMPEPKATVSEESGEKGGRWMNFLQRFLTGA